MRLVVTWASKERRVDITNGVSHGGLALNQPLLHIAPRLGRAETGLQQYLLPLLTVQRCDLQPSNRPVK